VCFGKLVAQTVTITEDEDGGPDIEELDGYVCSDCGLSYKNLPKAKVVKQKEWEWKIIEEIGGS
jgi:hypothetical protein